MVLFAQGTPLFSDFKQSSRVCQKQRFQPEIRTFCHFHTGHTTFLSVFGKLPEFVQNSFFSPRLARFVIFARAHHLLASSTKCTSLCKSEFSAQEQNVLTCLHWAHYLFISFRQTARFCQKQRFQPEVSTFCHFCTDRTTF